MYFELARRYPEFQEEVSSTRCYDISLADAFILLKTTDGGLTSASSAYDDVPSPDFPNSPRSQPNVSLLPRSGRTSEDRGLDSGYGGSTSGRKASEDSYGSRRRPSEDEYAPRRGEDAYSGVGRTSEDSYSASRRKPSQDTTVRRSEDRDRDFSRRPNTTVSTNSDSTGATNAQSATATSGMIIPNKSTIAEEEIEVPYGREIRESSSTAIDDRDRGDRDRSARDVDTDGVTDGEGPESASDYRSPLGGLSGLSARLRGVEVDEDDGGGARSGDDYYDKMSLGRASVQSDRSNGNTGITSRMAAGRASTGGDEQERLRRDYEYKIATMQSRIAGLERDLGNVDERERKWAESEERVRQMEEELVGLRKASIDNLFVGFVADDKFSEPRSKVRLCVLYKRSWMSCVRLVRGTKREKIDGLGLMRRNCRSCEIVVNVSKKSGRIIRMYVVDFRPPCCSLC